MQASENLHFSPFAECLLPEKNGISNATSLGSELITAPPASFRPASPLRSEQSIPDVRQPHSRGSVRTAALVTAASQRDVRHITFVLDHLVYGSVDPEHRFAEVVDVAPATIRDAGGDGDERPL